MNVVFVRGAALLRLFIVPAMRRSCVVVATISLGACSLQELARPVPAYADAAYPLDQTAIFSPYALRRGDQHPTFNDGFMLISIDGDDTGCPIKSCPKGVRVKPGDHHFTLRYMLYDNGLISYKSAQVVVDVSDMRPLHVYGVEASNDGGTLKTRPVDFGAIDSYGVYIGLKGVNEDFYPFSFAK